MTALAVVLVRIYELSREWTTFAWLCDACAQRRRGDNWQVRRPKLAPPNNVRVIDNACPVDLHDRITLTCDDCGANRDPDLFPNLPTQGFP